MAALQSWEAHNLEAVELLSSLVNDLIKRSFHVEGQWGDLESCTELRETLKDKLRRRIRDRTERLESVLARMAMAADSLMEEVFHPEQGQLQKMLQEQTILSINFLQELKESDTSLDPSAAQIMIASWQMMACVDSRLLAECKALAQNTARRT